MGQYEIIKTKQEKTDGGFEVLEFRILLTFDGEK